MSELKISFRKTGPKDKILVVKIIGYIDTHSCTIVEKKIKNKISGGDIKILVEASEVGFISSSGVGVFVELLSEVEEKGGCLHFFKASEKVIRSFEITTVDELIKNFNNEEEAVNYIVGG